MRDSVQRVKQTLAHISGMKGNKPVDYFHRKLGKILWEKVGIYRTEEGMRQALPEILALEEQWRREGGITGGIDTVNQELEKAIHLEDYFALARLVIKDALQRKESCGSHFRTESATPDGDTLRNDALFQFVGAWEYKGPQTEPVLHKEPLEFKYVKPGDRTYNG